MLTWLVPLFALTALIYASVGFAGGSTYTALMVLAGVPFIVIPVISLACNLIVSVNGTVQFARAGQIPWRRALPILLLSVPAAWLGGRIHVDQTLFMLLLGGSLCQAGILLLLGPAPSATRAPAGPDAGPGLFALIIAAPLGLLSGLVGIGGGIFLAPILHLVGWDSARRIAGTAIFFIFANSLAGLVGQLMKLGSWHVDTIDPALAAALSKHPSLWVLLALAVAFGGFVGSRSGSIGLPQHMIRRLTGALILFTGVRLLIG
jgi:uncharacterized membrane protein YfcA